ncbi:coproporphyrinogen dehydrogenase HemZ [Alkaliphilus hydrothermalis]|uniref:Oxygen-independent coproporphyrinogen-3 oxidase n=1 Tax=Alkaliphilus hydrothermalis TaxID=1482730 RepID=A0ABS2NLS3_9FIRM|nr:coproporphyrinogen dehydrogenase HemZ [Alkaliphilus hydrothermalis]MBM7613898.1 oxygen-independent coproporphyrinogen-3 oxidase [Alkaliphilus hydrothermalis]
MIKVVCIGHDYAYEVKELLKLFYPTEEMSISTNKDDLSNPIPSSMVDEGIISRIDILENQVKVTTEVYYDGKSENVVEVKALNELHEKDPQVIRKISKTLIKRGIFQLLKQIKKTYLPWGILVGIRPTKIVHELMEEGKTSVEILQILQEEYYIQEDKGQLLLSVAEREHPYIYPIDESKVSIYISIPFCPTRCVYCSFPSNPMKQWGYLQDAYVEALCKEIIETSKLIREKGKDIENIYIGGGTPSTLNIQQLEKLFNCLEVSFDIKDLKEFTFEAGRPDTIDEEKLTFLKNKGVGRLSINPQTMNDCTLESIGRDHSAEDLKESFRLAQKVGFENINMDLIIGLPGETSEMVEHTMKEIQLLQPTNLTVHTLAVKRASKLKDEKDSYDLQEEEEEIIKMLGITQAYADKMELKPYYMYRQKHMLGHLENIGYCRPGYEGIYNIQIMEEKQTIIAFGAGAVSKFVYPKENRLERVPNIKNLEQYLVRVEEMVERKKIYI